MATEQQLPEGWKKTTFEDVAQVVSGGTPSTKLETNFAEKGKGIGWITPADLSKYTDKFISNGARDLSIDGYKSCSAKLLPAGTVLLSSRAPIGYVAIAQSELSTNQGFKNFILSDDILSEYAYYYLKSIKSTIESLGSGTTFLELSASNAKKIPIIYPTSKETQQAIVNKIESLFDEIDEGIGRLKTAAQQIQQYRQSLLKNAFNGELTKEWRSKHADTLPSENELLAQIQTAREQHHAQQLADWQTAVSQWEQNGKEGKKPSKPKAPTQTIKFEENFADLPSGWGMMKLEALSKKITDGEHFKPPVQEDGIYFLSAKDIRENGISLDEPLFIDQATAEKARRRCDPEKGDIVIVSRGATVGRMCLVNIDEIFCLLGSVILIKPLDFINNVYLNFAMQSPKTNQEMIGLSGSTAQQAIYLRDIKNINIPICSLAEQTQIVAILESKLTACDQLAAELAKQLKQAELLKQAVLKAAFSGNLLDK